MLLATSFAGVSLFLSAVGIYGVLAFFTVGKTGFAVGGATINDPEHIQKDFTAISQILETFRPSPKLGGPPSRPMKAAVSGD